MPKFTALVFRFKNPFWTMTFVLLLLGFSLLSYGFWYHIPITHSTFKTQTFGDQGDHGNSKSTLEQINSSFKINWNLLEGFDYPYSGVNWSLEDSTKQCLDWNHLHHIHFQFKTEKNASFLVVLREFVPGWSLPGMTNTYRPRIVRIWSNGGILQDINIPIRDFSVPDWWHVDYRNSPQNDVFTHLVCKIELSFDGPIGSSGSIVIHDIKAQGNQFYIWLGSLFLFLAIMLGVTLTLIKLKNTQEKLSQLQAKLTLEKKVRGEAIPLNDWDKVQRVLEELWNLPELHLALLAEKSQIPAHRLTTLIRQKTGHSFKSLLNDLRLERAERLLSDTQEQVAQISNQCGYTHVTHFYRVFKQKHSMSPGDWRAQQQSKSTEMHE